MQCEAPVHLANDQVLYSPSLKEEEELKVLINIITLMCFTLLNYFYH